MKRYKKVPESKHVRYFEYANADQTKPNYEISETDPEIRSQQLDRLKKDLREGKIRSLTEKNGVCYIRSVDREGCIFHHLMDDTITETGRKRFDYGSLALPDAELDRLMLEYEHSGVAKYEEILEEHRRGWVVSFSLICGLTLPYDHDPCEFDDGIYDGGMDD